MSKLDDILKEASMGNVNSQSDRVNLANQQLKNLMSELIDPDGPNWTTSEYDYLDYTKLTAAIEAL